MISNKVYGIENEIEKLQCKMNGLLDKGTCLTDLYELSIELDDLIVQYYNRMIDNNKIY